MTDDHSAFVGAIPANYDEYLGPLIFEVYAKELARRVVVPEGGLVLETAAGTGLATREIRKAIDPSVRIIATDLNSDMLELAKTKFDDSDNVEFQTANAQELPFDDGTFDAIVCQFSVMFFPDKLTALKEAGRVLKPGGHFYFSIWDSLAHNDFIRTTNAEIATLSPGEPPDFFNTPYGYFEIDTVKELLELAGFGEIEISVLPRRSTAPKARHVALGYILGTPVRLQIESATDETLAEVVDRVERAIGNAYGDAPATAMMQAITFSARFPD